MKILLPALIRSDRARFAVAALFAAALTFSAADARSEDASNSNSGSPISPVEEFSQQLEAFQRSVPDLSKSIQDSASTIDSVTDPEKARAEIDRFARPYPGC